MTHQPSERRFFALCIVTLQVQLLVAVIVCSVLTPAQQNAGLIDEVRVGNLASVNAMLAKGADLNVWGPEGITPLLVAASMGNVPIAKALLAKGAQANVKDSSSWQVSPLMVAAFSGRVEMMKLLLDNKADLELENKDGSTALFFASQAENHKPGVDLLLERGAQKLPAKDVLSLVLEVGFLPNSKCFGHIGCSNSKKDK